MNRTGHDVPLPRPPVRTRQTIGDFARAVGLSASALRQYGETGLLTPAEIDERTGYRYYSHAQQQRAIWIRRLRDAGLSPRHIREILDAEPRDAERKLDAWLSEAGERQETAAALASDLRHTLRARGVSNPMRRTSASFDGTVLAATLDQVTAASATARSTEVDTAFAGVLLEVGPHDVSVAATDRYLLIARLAVSNDVHGPPARLSLYAGSATDWLRPRRRVELIVDAPVGRDSFSSLHARFRSEQGDAHELHCQTDPFPSVRELLSASGEARTRVVFGRDDVVRLSGADGLSLIARDGQAQLRSHLGTAYGSSSGNPVSVELSGALLRRIGDAAVGSLLSGDFGGETDAVVWRAPSQPDFVALMMPRAT